MVKRQKEKQYQGAREHKRNSQIRSGSGIGGSAVQRKLPFKCCALTLTPFVNPVCNPNGIVFDNAALTEFLMKYKKDPVTGKPLETRDIITLNMDQDEEGRWQCPVLTKPFADHSKIVAILDKSTKEAYVYSYEAYRELNVKPKSWQDLTTGKKFSPKTDVLILNDPQDEEFQKSRDIETFWHIRNSRTLQKSRPQNNVNYSVTATRIMEKIEQDKKRAKPNDKPQTELSDPASKKLKIFSDDVTSVKFTSGKASGSFTSTAMAVSNDNTTREASQEEILQAQFKQMRSQKQKGYVRMITNFGDLLLELHCDIAPRYECRRRRAWIKSMVDCGSHLFNVLSYQNVHQFSWTVSSPEGGSSKSGDDASIWGPAFVDEFDDRLKHVGVGVLSSANAGPNTNKRQFFITFKTTPHLDRIHSVFGQVIDGEKVLKKMEEVATDKKDRPLKPITILTTEILVDPAKEAEEKEHERLTQRAKAREEEEKRKEAMAVGKSAKQKKSAVDQQASSSSTAIGKYLPTTGVQQTAVDTSADGTEIPISVAKKVTKPKGKASFGDFSGW
eukprot:scaffold1727_cov133-Cylindrotheca_fusiformis.AAC.29